MSYRRGLGATAAVAPPTVPTFDPSAVVDRVPVATTTSGAPYASLVDETQAKLPAGIQAFPWPANCPTVLSQGPVYIPEGPSTALPSTGTIPLGTRFVAVWVPSLILGQKTGYVPTAGELERIMAALGPVSLNDAVRGEVTASYNEPVGVSTTWTSEVHGKAPAATASDEAYGFIFTRLIGANSTRLKQKAMARWRIEAARAIKVVWGPTFDPMTGHVYVGYELIRPVGEPAIDPDCTSCQTEGGYTGHLYTPALPTLNILSQIARLVGQMGLKREGIEYVRPQVFLVKQPYDAPGEAEWFYPPRRLVAAVGALNQGLKHVFNQAPLSAVSASVHKNLVVQLESDIALVLAAPNFFASLAGWGNAIVSQAREAASSLPPREAEAAVRSAQDRINELQRESERVFVAARAIVARNVMDDEEQRIRLEIATKLQGVLEKAKATGTRMRDQHVADWQACGAIKQANYALASALAPLDGARQTLPQAKATAQQILQQYEGSVAAQMTELQQAIAAVEAEIGLAWWERTRGGLPVFAWVGAGAVALTGGVIVYRRMR